MPQRILKQAPMARDAASVSEPAPDAPVLAWPVLDEEQTRKCRELAKGKKAYVYENCGQKFVYTGLLSGEWNKLVEKWEREKDTGTLAGQDEDTCQAGVIWPQITDPRFWRETALAGHAQALAALIRRTTGFTIILETGEIYGDTLTVTELDPPEAEFPEEPSEEEIEAFRKKSGTGQVFLADFDPSHKYLFLPLPRSEWISINNRIRKDQEVDAALETVRSCVVWPRKDYEQEQAGYVTRLFDEVCRHSGFNAEAQVVEL